MAPLCVGRFRLWPDWYWRCRVCRVESLPLVSWQVALAGALAHCALAASRAGVEEVPCPG